MLKKSNFLIIALAFMGLSASVANAQYQCGDNLYWDYNSSTKALTITGWGDMYDFGSYWSTPWYSRAYSGSITSLSLPAGITSISDNAFHSCVNLTSLTIPNSVTSIGDYAFRSCHHLKSVTIPSSVTKIGWRAFEYCSDLTTVNFNATNCTSMGHIFESCENLTTLNIGSNVTNIPDWAFPGCQIKSLTIPNSVTKIGDYAFGGCGDLTSLTIPNSVASIGDYAFDGCSSLTSLTIGSSVTSIGDYAFAGCSDLTTITSKAINAPEISTNSFFGVENSIPLYVLCGSIWSYQRSYFWLDNWGDYFTNIQAILTYNITVESNNIQMGEASIIQQSDCDNGNQVIVLATANDGYEFVHWLEDGTKVSANAEYSFTATDNRTLVAVFNKMPEINLFVNMEIGGTVSGGGIFLTGEKCTAIATANEGYRFVGWREKGSLLYTSYNAIYEFTVFGNKNLEAVFEKVYEISLSANPTNGGTVNGDGTFKEGALRMVTANANAGYMFMGWQENGKMVSANTAYVFMLKENKTLVAVFRTPQSNLRTIALSSIPDDGGTTTGDGIFAIGTERTITATPNKGYIFANWLESDTIVSTDTTYTFTLTGNRTFIAVFQETETDVSDIEVSEEEGITVVPEDVCARVAWRAVEGAGAYVLTVYAANRTDIICTFEFGANGKLLSFSFGQQAKTKTAATEDIFGIRVSNLSPKTTYYYTMQILGEGDTVFETKDGTFTTTGAGKSTYFVAASGNDSNNGLSQETAFKTFQHACAVAETGDIIAIVGKVPVSGNAAIPAAAGLTIVGAGSDAILDGEGTTPVMDIRDDVEGVGEETYDYFFANLTIQNAFRSAAGGGGAISIDAPVKLRFSNCKFLNNKTDCLKGNNDDTWNGGAIRANGADVEIYNCVFNGNRAFAGGALEILNANSLIVENSVFKQNSTYVKGGGARDDNAIGGALVARGCSSTMINNCLFAGNSTYRDASDGAAGGAMFVMTADGGNVDVINSAFVDNNTFQHAGAISADGYNAIYTFINTTFSGNQCKDAGGVIFAPFSGNNAEMNIINCTMSGNKTLGNTGHSGGIMLMGPKKSLKIHNSIIEGNTAQSGGLRNSDISYLYNECIIGSIDVRNSYVGSYFCDAAIDWENYYATTVNANSQYDYIAPGSNFYSYSQSGISFNLANTDRSFYYPLKAGYPAVNGGNKALLLAYDRSDDQFGVERNSPCSIGAVEAILEGENLPNDMVIAEDDNYTEEMKTIIAMVSYAVSLSSMPANGGTLSGNGTYQVNTSHTVTATANAGYTFICWMEGIVPVSASANYTFTVTGNRTLVAIFQETTITGVVVETRHATSLQVVGYYSILGQKLPQEPQSGLYIILYDNGKAVKILK